MKKTHGMPSAVRKVVSVSMCPLVPSKRLLWIAGVVVVPAATLAGAMPEWAGVCGLAMLALVALAVVDAWLGWSRLDRVAVDAPAVIHGARGRVVDLQVPVQGLVTTTRIGLSLPDVVRCADPVVRLEPAEAVAEWPLRVLKRGRHRFDFAFVEAASPIGLWLRRRAVPLGTELLVYPDLRRERTALSAVFLNRGGLGRHARAQVGKGREYDHLRDYTAGDDFGDIHWKSTARRGFPVTKTFQIERTREVYVVIDHSRLSARELPSAPSPPDDRPAQVAGAPMGGDAAIETHLERALESALALGLAAERQHDLFGLVTFADQVTRFIRAGAGRAHYGSCRNAVLTLEPRLVAPDFEELFVSLRRSLTRRALVVILTDLSDPLQAEAFVRDVRLVAQHHVVIVSMIRPPRAAPLFSNPGVEDLDDIFRDLSGHFLWHDLQEVTAVLARQGVRLSLPDSAALTVDVVSRYMEVKNRQLL
ncbi:MAG: DUF58 domain-containing protein [Verrucomicrobiales bacterium]